VPVEAAFQWIKGPWKLLVEARELGSCLPARGDADHRSGGGSEQNAGAADVSDSPLPHQVDGNGEGVAHASDGLGDVAEGQDHALRQCKDGNLKTMTGEESSEFDAPESDTLPMNQMDKSHEDDATTHDSEQDEYGILSIMPKKASDL
jgi:hypothetical protein